jgi:hypothetical protein
MDENLTNSKSFMVLYIAKTCGFFVTNFTNLLAHQDTNCFSTVMKILKQFAQFLAWNSENLTGMLGSNL